MKPMAVSAQESDVRVKSALNRLRRVTDRSITSACEFARESRTSVSTSKMKSVQLPASIPASPAESDVTSRFEAIRARRA